MLIYCIIVSPNEISNFFLIYRYLLFDIIILPNFHVWYHQLMTSVIAANFYRTSACGALIYRYRLFDIIILPNFHVWYHQLMTSVIAANFYRTSACGASPFRSAAFK